jgi:two-component system cell cycle response regulator DivK
MMEPVMTTILYVEDNEDNVYMLTRRLKKKSYNVEVAGDGAAGVAAAQSLLPDLIIMDMSLPIMDGWEASRHIKANASTAHIPIIGFSAHAMTGDREKAMAAGCDDYDTKPVEFDRLLDKIERLLQGRGA